MKPITKKFIQQIFSNEEEFEFDSVGYLCKNCILSFVERNKPIIIEEDDLLDIEGELDMLHCETSVRVVNDNDEYISIHLIGKCSSCRKYGSVTIKVKEKTRREMEFKDSR